jgi:hypothetical protein
MGRRACGAFDRVDGMCNVGRKNATQMMMRTTHWVLKSPWITAHTWWERDSGQVLVGFRTGNTVA